MPRPIANLNAQGSANELDEVRNLFQGERTLTERAEDLAVLEGDRSKARTLIITLSRSFSTRRSLSLNLLSRIGSLLEHEGRLDSLRTSNPHHPMLRELRRVRVKPTSSAFTPRVFGAALAGESQNFDFVARVTEYFHHITQAHETNNTIPSEQLAAQGSELRCGPNLVAISHLKKAWVLLTPENQLANYENDETKFYGSINFQSESRLLHTYTDHKFADKSVTVYCWLRILMREPFGAFSKAFTSLTVNQALFPAGESNQLKRDRGTNIRTPLQDTLLETETELAKFATDENDPVARFRSMKMHYLFQPGSTNIIRFFAKINNRDENERLLRTSASRVESVCHHLVKVHLNQKYNKYLIDRISWNMNE